MPDRAPDDVGRADQVDADRLAPRALPLVVVGGVDGVLREHRRVVHHHVETAAEAVRRRVHETLDRGRIADVSLHHQVALARQLREEPGGKIGGVARVDGDAVAGGGEGTRRGAADTA